MFLIQPEPRRQSGVSNRRGLILYAIFLLVFLVVGINESYGSSCCGGGFAAPAVIVGEERAQATASYSYGMVDTEVFASGIWQDRNTRETIETVRLSAAHVFADRWQAGLAVPVLKKSREGHNATNLGDAAINLGYELIPDWDYSVWRPKGVAYLSGTAPTGLSSFDARDIRRLDASGRGFWAMGLGLILIKNWETVDANMVFDVHRSFARTVQTQSGQGTLEPGYGGSYSVGVGYNLGNFRLGTSIQWVYEDPIPLRTSLNSSTEASSQRYAVGTATLSYLWSRAWASSVSYSDQTLFGSPLNTALERSVMVSLQRRWAR